MLRGLWLPLIVKGVSASSWTGGAAGGNVLEEMEVDMKE